jgi:tRNA 2-thiouridine synthesizing protein A
MGVKPIVKKKVDAIGMYCPEPVFALRKALDDVNIGDSIEFLADDPAAEEDVKRLVSRLGEKVESFSKNGDIIRIIITKVK